MQANSKLRTYSPAATALAFPLGGIGTGNVSLGARGDLRDWEICNRPAKGTVLPNTFFALRVQQPNGEAITRVLEGQVQPPFDPSHGFDPTTGIGLPRFANCTFRGEYPFAQIDLSDDAVPVSVSLEAYTPLVPLDPADSGIPGAVFSFTLTNTSDQPVSLTLVGSMMNPVGHHLFDPIPNNKRDTNLGRTINEVWQSGDLRGLYFHADGIEPDALEYGDLCLVTDHPDVTTKRHWRRGAWWDFLREFWDDLDEDGRLTDLGYDTLADYPDTGSLGLLAMLAAGESRTFRFFLTWYFPNRINSWDVKPERRIRNHYATRFSSAREVAETLARELERLERATRQFYDSLFVSTLPAPVLDALSANIVPVRSNTCFWLEDGRFYGWEGCFDGAGCCHGSCTHVWSYAQTVAFLFPSLEREMRNIEFRLETEPDGYMSFRTQRTFDGVWEWRGEKIAAVDGQMGSIIRAYREWLLSGDKDWLASVWDGVKAAMKFAAVQWDTDNDGVLDGRQHNTYDIEFFGPNSLCTIYFLGALRACEAMALVLDDAEMAGLCRRVFEVASPRAEALLWNGAYYQQTIEDVDAHPYQYGEGCLSDQLLGQLHARLLGLGDLLPADHVRAAIKAVYDYNFRRGFEKHVNVQRVFALNDEAGLILCSWPLGGRPRFPFVYSDEVWTGIEYHVAAHLIYEGWLEEGLNVVEAARARHDGVRRNPYNEVECGHHYARSMSSWALLNALSGVHADSGKNELRFDPVLEASTEADAFSTFWSSGKAWGTYRQQRDAATGAWQPTVEVLGGDAMGLQVTACGQTWTI